MLGILYAIADRENIAVAFQQAGQFHRIGNGGATRLCTGDKNLQWEVFAQSLLHGIQELNQESAAVFYTVHAVFIMTVIVSGLQNWAPGPPR